ncbi:MAG: response regulator transcription factor [Ilumatobacteraceae bacterium]
MVSVLVCDDQELVRDALRVVLSEDDEIEIRLAASGVSDAVTALDTDGVDVAVIDVRLPEESGLSIADWIRDHRPSTKVVLISVRVTDELLVESASLGVAAVVDKSIGVVELSRIVREVSAGRNFLTRDVVRAAQSRLETRGFARLANLGDVDREIMRLIAQGLSDREIASKVYLSPQTVRNRVSRLLTHLGRENRTQLALMVAEFDDLNRRFSH